MKQIYWSVHEGKRLLADGFVAAEDDRSAMALVSVGGEVGRVLKPGKWVTLKAGALVASVDGPQDAGRVKDTMGWGEKEEQQRVASGGGGHLFAEPKRYEVDLDEILDLDKIIKGHYRDYVRKSLASSPPNLANQGYFDEKTFDAIRRIVDRQVPANYAPWRIVQVEYMHQQAEYGITIASDWPQYAGHNAKVWVTYRALANELSRG